MRVALLAKERGRARTGGAMRAMSLFIALLTSGCLASISAGRRGFTASMKKSAALEPV